jgi:pimeloyl-[acyl-carrier protein] methyl ester esterase
MSSAIWRLQLEGLAGSCRIIVTDLPGHGQSPDPAGGFSIRSCIDDLTGLFESLDLHEAVLVGWSLGGLIALASIPFIEERLSGVVLVAATPRFTRSDDFPYGLSRLEVEGMARKVQRSMRRALDGFTGRMFVHGERDEPAQAALIDDLLSQIPLPTTAVALQALAELSGTDLRDCLARITLPTLIVNGDRDVICLPQASEFLAQQIPSSRQAVFAGCGHAPFLTQGSRFNECLEQFRRMVSIVD